MFKPRVYRKKRPTNATKPQKPAGGHPKRMQVLQVMAALFGWKTIVELGVWKADTALHLLLNFLDLRWVGVDRYKLVPGALGQPGWSNYGYADMERMYLKALEKLRPFGARAEIIRDDSAAAAVRFADGSIDAVFIDADHRYERCLADIDAWEPKVRPGGWLVGHDYDMPSVRRAVEVRIYDPVILPDRMWGVRC